MNTQLVPANGQEHGHVNYKFRASVMVSDIFPKDCIHYIRKVCLGLKRNNGIYNNVCTWRYFEIGKSSKLYNR